MSGNETDADSVDTSSQDPAGQALRMLIVDDDPQVGLALEDFFESQGYEVTRATDGEQALERMKAQQPGYDIVLLDVMLPKKSGFEVLRASQEMGLVSPVLMVSARGEQETVLQGFGLGAADYVVKPFDPEELAARVKAILGRSLPPAEAPMDVYRFGDVEINFSTGEVWRRHQKLALSEVEFDLLQYLVRHRGQTVTRKRLLREAWRIDADMITFTVDQETVAGTLDRCIASLRTHVEPNPFEPQFIETVFGQGYRFNG